MDIAQHEMAETGRRSGMGIRTLFFVMLIAFAGGIAATIWLIRQPDLTAQAPFLGQILSETGEDAAVIAPGPATPPAMPPQNGQSALSGAVTAEQALAARIAEMEYRLSHIDAQANAAADNAGRAEGLLIAFAARRALDKGAELGYIENQLQLHFGAMQPMAVQTVIKAARSPVTQEDLQAGLSELGDTLTVGQEQADLWTAFQREMGELFVLRKGGTPSPAPSQRLDRARRFTTAGNVRAAIAEVEKLPGASKAEPWLEQARRYSDARDALDRIEYAALFDPARLRSKADRPAAKSAATPDATAP